MELSHREKKKLETRQAIYLAATKLFAKRGYAKTTLQDIATAAHVSQRTIFAYYPSKEAIIFEPHQQVLDDLFALIQNRGDTTVFEVLAAFDIPKQPAKEAEAFQILVDQSPDLQEYLARMLAMVEAKLTTIIAAEQGLPPQSLQAHLIAACCRTVIAYIMEDCDDQAAPGIGLSFIEGGLKATATQ